MEFLSFWRSGCMPRLQRVLHSAHIWALYSSYMLWPHIKQHITAYKVKATSHVQVNLWQVLSRFSVENRNEASAFPFLAFALLTGIGTRWLHWRGEQLIYMWVITLTTIETQILILSILLTLTIVLSFRTGQNVQDLPNLSPIPKIVRCSTTATEAVLHITRQKTLYVQYVIKE